MNLDPKNKNQKKSEYKFDVGAKSLLKITQKYSCCRYTYTHILRDSNYYQAKTERGFFEKHKVMTPAHQQRLVYTR